MTEIEVAISELQVVPKGMFSKTMYLFEADKQVAEVRLRSIREACEVYIEQEVYKVSREKMMRGAFYLATADEKVIVRAEKLSALTSSFDVHLGSKVLKLKKASLLTSRFQLLHDDEPVGQISRNGMFTRKATVTLPAGLPLAVRIFIYCLTQFMWNREDAAAG